MGKIFTAPTWVAGFNAGNTLQTALDNIETALDKCVSRDGEAPNAMNSALDMNNYNILNVDTIDVADLTIDGSAVPSLADVQAAQTASEAAQTAAEAAQTAAETAEANAEAAVASINLPTISGGDAGKLLEVNPGETAYQFTSGVDASQIATDAVVTAKIQNNAVTADKLATNSVTTSKINDLAVTTAKKGG